MKKFNMDQCKKGDKLISKDGTIFTFKRKTGQYVATCMIPPLEHECTFSKNGAYLNTGEESGFDIIGFFTIENLKEALKNKICNINCTLSKIQSELSDIRALINLQPPKTVKPVKTYCNDCKHSFTNPFDQMFCSLKNIECKRACNKFMPKK